MNNTLTLAIIGHLVGDYLIQNDWMALNKKSDPFPCTVHCLIWSWSVLWFSGWVHVHGWRGALAAVLLYTTHFIQDRTNLVSSWMDLIGQRKFRTGPCAPWSLIVVDNCWHIVTIWVVWQFIA